MPTAKNTTPSATNANTENAGATATEANRSSRKPLPTKYPGTYSTKTAIKTAKPKVNHIPYSPTKTASPTSRRAQLPNY